MSAREENLRMAEFADASARYDDMAEYMKRVVQMSTASLAPWERDCLIVAYKNSVSSRRHAIAAIDRIAPMMAADAQADIAGYRGQVVGELSGICEDIVALLEANLIPMSTEEEEKVMYFKTQGDFYRYLAPYGQAGSPVPQKAADAYAQAMNVASSGLPPENSTRLGAALNQSVCMHEVLGQTEQAIELARAIMASLEGVVFETAEKQEETEQFKCLVKENLNLWTKPSGGGDGTMIEEM